MYRVGKWGKGGFIVEGDDRGVRNCVGMYDYPLR